MWKWQHVAHLYFLPVILTSCCVLFHTEYTVVLTHLTEAPININEVNAAIFSITNADLCVCVHKTDKNSLNKGLCMSM